jgi:hypothetical protein
MMAIREKWFELAVLALYAVILTALLSNHVFWRDEMQAWLIARDSASLVDLFKNLRYEGHPGLWHLLLMPATRLTRNPEIMHWLQAVLAIGTMSIVVLASPLSRLEKAIIPFTYFPLIEYGILSRSYILGFLLVALVCVVWPRRFERPVILAALLALLANVHIFFTIMAIAFALAYASTRLRRKRRRLAAENCSPRRSFARD